MDEDVYFFLVYYLLVVVGVFVGALLGFLTLKFL